MIEIKAVFRPGRLPALRNALMDTPGFPGMTVTRVEGCSAPGSTGKSSIKEELTDYSAKIRIEIVCSDEVADRLMDRIVEVCQTGQIGDGVVWKTDVDRVFFIAKNFGAT